MVTTVILGGIIFSLMGLVISRQVKKVKSGESGCGCGCSGCSSQSACHGAVTQKK